MIVMKNVLKLLGGFAMGGLTAFMAEVAPMIVPALLAIMVAGVVIDSLADA